MACEVEVLALGSGRCQENTKTLGILTHNRFLVILAPFYFSQNCVIFQSFKNKRTRRWGSGEK